MSAHKQWTEVRCRDNIKTKTYEALQLDSRKALLILVCKSGWDFMHGIALTRLQNGHGMGDAGRRVSNTDLIWDCTF